MKFHISEIDHDLLKKRAREEARQIFLKESTRQNRTEDEIVATVLYGQAAEVYLIQHQGFKDDERPYKDVLDPNGKDVEVKVTESEQFVPYVVGRCNEAALQKWRKYPKKLYVFIGDRHTLDYHLYSTYSYNGTEFIKD